MNYSDFTVEDVLECREIVDGLTGLEHIVKDFYYDETNNYRKFHFKSGSLNIENAGEFLLGGVVVNQGYLVDISQLKKDIKLDKSAGELKFKHVAKGALPDVLKSRKFKTILEYLKDQSISLHLLRANSFYWGIVDIVESVELQQDLLRLHLSLKDCLYHALVSKTERTIAMLHEYNYPDVDSLKIKNFYNEISNIVKDTPGYNGYIQNALLEALHIGSTQGKADFIQDEERGVLVDNYNHFYRDRIMTFPLSSHFIDNEENVKASFAQVGSSFKGTKLSNYKFVNSHESDGVQLSDVVIGLMAKILDFCNAHSHSELISLRRNASSIEREILDLAGDLITRSNNESRAYFINTLPYSHINNWTYLLKPL